MNELRLLRDVRAIGQLRDSEIHLKEAAWVLELSPGRRAEAERLFALAGRVRAERQELLERCGLS